MKLYGTTTSPFVRRVRIVAHELGERVELVDSASEAGQAALRRASPIWKVPVAEVDGRVLFDSRAIVDWLTTTRGHGELAPPRDRFADGNRLNAVDEALGSAIQVFYLQRDGVDTSAVPWAIKNRERIAAIFRWLEGELEAGRLGRELGLVELSLVCALEWMDFRAAYPTTDHPGFAPLRAAHRERPSLVATRPQT